MSSLFARRVASAPVRTAVQTWARIVEIVAPNPENPAREELAKVLGTACASIASEAPKEAPIVIWGGGPRVRVYCVFDEDAITQDGINEDALPKSPTEGDWRMSIPFLADDVAWSAASLAAASSRVSARSVDDDVADEEPLAASTMPLSINLAEFLKS
jgi:cellulase/cellobiase CelA1